MLLMGQMQRNPPRHLAVDAAALWALVLLIVAGGGLLLTRSHQGLLLHNHLKSMSRQLQWNPHWALFLLNVTRVHVTCYMLYFIPEPDGEERGVVVLSRPPPHGVPRVRHQPPVARQAGVGPRLATLVACCTTW